jgi:hypothetical protein
LFILKVASIVGAVQKVWKKLISEYGRLHDIENDIDRLKCDKKKPCIYFYNLYLENIKKVLLGHKKTILLIKKRHHYNNIFQ